MKKLSKKIALVISLALSLLLGELLWSFQDNGLSRTSTIVKDLIGTQYSTKSKPTLIHNRYFDRRPEWNQHKHDNKSQAVVQETYRLPTSINTSSVEAAEESFFKFLTKLDGECPKVKRIGSEEDGGWEICVSSPFTPRTPCLVYSFGYLVWKSGGEIHHNMYRYSGPIYVPLFKRKHNVIAYESSFDEAMYETYNCTVRMYDPSLNKDIYKNMKPGASFHIVKDKMIFYKVGLGAQNGLQRQGQHFWMIKTFTSLLEENNEQEVFIDVLKIDIEYAEWDSLKAMLKDSQLNFVKQLVIEIHTPDVFKTQTPIPDIRKFEEMFTLLRGLELFGFRKYFLHINHYCTGIISRASGKPIQGCFEISYFNSNFIK